MPTQMFQQLVEALKQPAQSTASQPYWPYPLTEADMIASYGLRQSSSNVAGKRPFCLAFTKAYNFDNPFRTYP